jgi:DNA damage-binding protein 1
MYTACNCATNWFLSRIEYADLVYVSFANFVPDGSGGYAERFVIGTAYLDDQDAVAERGRIIILEITRDRQLKHVAEIAVKGGCRCLAMCEGKIVAALIKTIVIYDVEFKSESKPDLVKAATFRCSTAPIDITGKTLPNTPQATSY